MAPLVRLQAKELDLPLDVADDVLRTLVDEPPALVREGSSATAADPELDELRSTSRGGRDTIAAISGGSASGRASSRSRSASTASSATTSRSASRTSPRPPPTTSASRRSPAASAS
ncbi:MAG: hypothetical protein U0599_04145 [Vicinamibacteria bacterium]